MHFVILADHPPNICPTANKTTQDLMLGAASEIPKLAQKHGVKFVAGPLVNWEHLVVIVAEAQKIESVWDFVYEAGLQQWNSVRVIPSMPIEEGVKFVEKAKPIF